MYLVMLLALSMFTLITGAPVHDISSGEQSTLDNPATGVQLDTLCDWPAGSSGLYCPPLLSDCSVQRRRYI